MGQETTLIIGAGVDKTNGIGLPLANELIPGIAIFAKKEGKKYEEAITSFLPNLRFSFNKIIQDSIELFASYDESKIGKIIKDLENESENGKDKLIFDVLKKLFSKVKNIKEEGKLDDETIKDIEKLLDEESKKELSDEYIIELSKASFTDSFRLILKAILKRSIENPNNPISKVLSQHFLDLESLLAKTFLGFYTESLTEIKKYLYISWMLWAYLKTREKEVLEKESIPFYPNIPEDFKVISFNYTSFLSKRTNLKKENYLYFHGVLDKYLKFDTRTWIELECEDIHEFLENTVRQNTDLKNGKYLLPGIIPPLKLKPVLSSNFIEDWYKANEWIQNSKRIIVIGYSFNYADEHFNDIIRKKLNNSNQVLYIINPDAENLKERIKKIFSLSDNYFTGIEKKEHLVFSSEKIKIIGAKADEIALDSIDEF
ncbi:hypothetical protein IM41_00365 [Fervidobacterium sp. SC_NGM5_G05]|nr:hypothetical protein IM41_00365 [Fervidobacterium sp. SC_NGM5_G05]